jgi:hypothetical protein
MAFSISNHSHLPTQQTARSSMLTVKEWQWKRSEEEQRNQSMMKKETGLGNSRRLDFLRIVHD